MTMPQQPVAAAGEGDPFNQAARLLQKGDAQGAATLLEQAVRENPNNGQAHQYLGIARLQYGDAIRGIASLRDAARLLPQDAVVAYNLGAALNQVGRTEEARNALERALVLDPGHQKARQALAELVRSGKIVPEGAPPPPKPLPPPASGLASSIPPTATVSTSPGLSSVGQAPAPAAPAMSALGSVGGGGSSEGAAEGGGLQQVGGGGGGLQPVGGGGGLQPVGGATAAPTAATVAPGGSATGMAGLASVGGGYTPPAGSPIAPPPPPPQLGAAGTLPASAMSGQMFSREPTNGERVQRGLMWGAIYGQIWTAVQSCFILFIFFFAQTTKHAATGLLIGIVIILVVAVGYAILGAILGLIIGSMGADEDQGGWIGVGTAILLVGGNLFLGGGIFGILIGGIGFFYISRVIGRLIAQKTNDRVDLFA